MPTQQQLQRRVRNYLYTLSKKHGVNYSVDSIRRGENPNPFIFENGKKAIGGFNLYNLMSNKGISDLLTNNLDVFFKETQ